MQACCLPSPAPMQGGSTPAPPVPDPPAALGPPPLPSHVPDATQSESLPSPPPEDLPRLPALTPPVQNSCLPALPDPVQGSEDSKALPDVQERQLPDPIPGPGVPQQLQADDLQGDDSKRSKPDFFLASDQWTGPLANCYFTTGPRGLGYYELKPQQLEADANPSNPEFFLASDQWTGPVANCYFTMGPPGLGYYELPIKGHSRSVS